MWLANSAGMLLEEMARIPNQRVLDGRQDCPDHGCRGCERLFRATVGAYIFVG